MTSQVEWGDYAVQVETAATGRYDDKPQRSREQSKVGKVLGLKSPTKTKTLDIPVCIVEASSNYKGDGSSRRYRLPEPKQSARHTIISL